MENKIEIRASKKEDIPEMMDLIKELALYEKSPNEVTVSLEEMENCGFGENPIFTSYVALLDAKIVGLALYYLRYSTWKGKRIYLEDLIVTKEYRRLGLGKRLFHRCLQDTLSLGASGMTWQVLDWNQPAIRFYNQFKFKSESGWLNGSIESESIHEIPGFK